MNDTFMKEKPVFPLILSMALPMVISMLVNSLYNIVDSFFVAQISENAMTALSLVFPVQNFANAIAIGFGIGISYICIGSKQRQKTRHDKNTSDHQNNSVECRKHQAVCGCFAGSLPVSGTKTDGNL